ncbi:MAG: hypothetical protein KF809_11150 [Chloroflexi bacterium]|nr:hypothetical protein [Chloroflexota bacterium]
MPRVLIVEGLISPPIAYRRMAARLRARGAAGVDLAPVHVLDWALAGASGFARLQRRVVRAIERTTARADGRPIMLIGHSGGGILARLALCDAPYRGHIGGASDRVAALVSLGSPHDLHLARGAAQHEGVRLARFLATHEPGACHAPRTGYLTVASDLVRGPGPDRPVPERSMLGRARASFFRTIVGPPATSGSDGIISAGLAHLPGARQLTLPDILHGVVGGPWYGDEAAIDQWWPAALEVWRDAIAARADTPPEEATG